MRVGWLRDHTGEPGGAELTQAEFRAAAPADVEVVDCPPGGVNPDCDVFVIHNCVTYTLHDLEAIGDAPAFKYWHDVGPWLTEDVRGWLEDNTTAICCSPAQAQQMNLVAVLIPPPVDLDRFSKHARSANGSRAGVCSVGSWCNPGKAPHRAAEWADGRIDFYGGGKLAPPGSVPVRYEDMPDVLARYQTFVFLPDVLEPFGRVVAEAWAAGCELVVNDLVGARYWIEENPDAIDTAGRDFWRLVTS